MSPYYTFNMGDSTDGPIGFVVRVTAKTPEEAADLVNAELPEMLTVHSDDGDIDYVNVYFNDMAVTAKDAEEE